MAAPELAAKTVVIEVIVVALEAGGYQFQL
jgi:hypothetical protein